MSFMVRLRKVAALSICLAVGSQTFLSGKAFADEVTVFAAASMKNAMDEISSLFEEETGHTMTVSLAGSSALARQIENGAPADIFVSANVGWMDRLQEAGLIKTESRFDLLNNSIVLIAHDKAVGPVDITPSLDLSGMLGTDHLAMALVDAVPAGIYGKAALNSLGLWQDVERQVVQADNVRAALALVSLGEAPFGIVYATDARADGNVSVIGTFPADSHPPIVYPAAEIAARTNPIASEALNYLKSKKARQAFARQGFVVVPE